MQSEQPPTNTWLKSACWHVSAQAGEFNPSVRDSDLWLYARMCSRVKGFDLALNGGGIYERLREQKRQRLTVAPSHNECSLTPLRDGPDRTLMELPFSDQIHGDETRERRDDGI